ncbi:Alpha/beta hydrolase family [Novymonas esmeraldas]|uniref:Alpha/beta hydrolase family n=1 Tax=Novymonas esmeraldas TaxID=1808958 RepID=A0AAW0EYM1_9TRYP
MLDRVLHCAVHSAIHLYLHLIPRCVRAVLVKLPVTLWQLLTGRRPLTYSSRKERHISVITSTTDPAASERLLKTFGLSKDMVYRGPLYNGHIHTILGNSRPSRRVTYERELLTADDGNPICLDWLRVPKAGATAKGVILLIPGLGNYGQTNYIQRFARCAVGRGYHVCLLTPRGMGSAPLTTPNITCLTFTADVRQVLRLRLQRDILAKEFGAALPLFAVAYSAGGSTLLKCMAEETQAQRASGGQLYQSGFPVEAAVSMIAPNDMEASAEMLRTRSGRLLYTSAIFTALRKYLRKHKDMLVSASRGKTEEEKRGMPLMHTDFDATMRLIREPVDIDTHIVAAHFGYADRFAYYRDGDSLQYVKRIAGLPVLCLNTRDDPIVGYAVPQSAWQAVCDANSNVAYVELPVGGHFGFVQNPWQEWLNPYSDLQTFPLDALDHLLSSRRAKWGAV